MVLNFELVLGEDEIIIIIGVFLFFMVGFSVSEKYRSSNS